MANYEWVDVWCGVVQEVQRVWMDTGRAGLSRRLEVDFRSDGTGCGTLEDVGSLGVE